MNRPACLLKGGASGAEHGLQQLGWVLLDAATVEVTRVYRNLGQPDHTLFGVDDDRLGPRGALVDGQDCHFTGSSAAPATSSNSASIEAISGILRPSLPRVTSRYPR